MSTNGERGGEHVRVAIIGTGFSGLGMAIRLKQEGIEDFVVLERADDLGGTWRDNHYPALIKPNVEVLTSGIEELRKRSIVTGDGRELEVDTVIFGTGFHVTDPPIATRIHGRDGRNLAETWNSSMQAYLGTAVAGFPNLFFILGPNTGLGHNSMIYMVESQVDYVLDCLRVMGERGTKLVEVRREAQDSYNRELQESMQGTVWTAGHCQSWYLDATGRNTTLWPGWTVDFRRRTRRFDPDKYVLESRTERVAAR